MKVSVVQHVLRRTPASDLEALSALAVRAACAGAQWIVLPEVLALRQGRLNEELWRRLEEDVPGVCKAVASVDDGEGVAFLDERKAPDRTVVLVGDACFSSETLQEAMRRHPGIAILSPRAESELQSEAAIEFAIGLSTSLASLVLVSETYGAERGRPGHGGSAIIFLGEILAEAASGEDVLLAAIELPVASPKLPEPLPELPLLLAQRVAAHKGKKLEVDYPADLD